MDATAEHRKGQFIWREGEDRAKKVDEILQKIKSGYFLQDSVLSNLVEKLADNFDSAVEGL